MLNAFTLWLYSSLSYTVAVAEGVGGDEGERALQVAADECDALRAERDALHGKGNKLQAECDRLRTESREAAAASRAAAEQLRTLADEGETLRRAQAELSASSSTASSLASLPRTQEAMRKRRTTAHWPRSTDTGTRMARRCGWAAAEVDGAHLVHKLGDGPHPENRLKEADSRGHCVVSAPKVVSEGSR